MIIVNDKNERYVNGSTGKIIDLNDSMVKIKLKNGNVVEVGFNKWASYELTKINNQKPDYEETGTYTQIPVVPAWAITVHKSQGKTLDNIYIDIEKSFAPGQIYVALSRVRKFNDFRIKYKISVGDIHIRSRLLDFQREGII
jgi:ATP-dependent exoDNAse (exonuclease V) alpha subunit